MFRINSEIFVSVNVTYSRMTDQKKSGKQLREFSPSQEYFFLGLGIRILSHLPGGWNTPQFVKKNTPTAPHLILFQFILIYLPWKEKLLQRPKLKLFRLTCKYTFTLTILLKLHLQMKIINHGRFVCVLPWKQMLAAI